MIYDLIVIGGGPAGYLAAERAGNAGLSTLLIEKNEVGGVCLNEGCIPTKTLLHSAKIYDNAKEGQKYGIFVRDAVLEHDLVVKRKDTIVKSLVSAVKMKLKRGNVAVVYGFGEISGRSRDGYTVDVGTATYTGKRLLLATGSTPVIPDIPGLKDCIEKGYAVTSREMLAIKKPPTSLAVIGGGVIGLEMASYFNSAGSKVTVIEMLDHIGGELDDEISGILLRNYLKKGIEFNLDSKVTSLQDNGITFESKELTKRANAETILICTGRKPMTEGLGLENIGVEVVNGKIKTDNKCRTNVPDVYAAGDCVGRFMLAHSAYREAEVCVANILGSKDNMRYDAVPSVIYTNPEVASAGHTEKTAKAAGIEFDSFSISMKYSGRYVAENEGGDGICKILTDKKLKKVIGAHIISNYASELIFGACIMIEMEMRIKDIKEIIFPHPTVSEIFRDISFEI